MCHVIEYRRKHLSQQCLNALSPSGENIDNNNKSVVVCYFNPDSVQNFKHFECFYWANQVPSSIAFMESREELTEISELLSEKW